jgi:putative ABC transport system substrate-binding protein
MKGLVKCFFGLAVALNALSPFPAKSAESAEKKIFMALWRGCEAACQGFQEEITAGGVKAEVIIRNADKDKTKLPGFVEEARALKADMVITWGTSVTLGMVGTMADTQNPTVLNDIPVVFMIVADPIASGIIESYEKTGRANVTGTRNRVPEAVNIATMQSYLPSFKKLGLLFNRDEANSVLKMEELRELSKSVGFELIALEIKLDSQGKPNPESIPVRMAELKEAGADFVYLGSSSFLRANSELFTRSTVENGLPLLSPYEKLVRESDALISVAAPYGDVGRLAARQVYKILIEGKAPGELPVASLDQFTYVINMAVARKLGLFPPIDILQFAETVN